MSVNEELYFEGGPHIGDLIFHVLLGFTLVGIPLTVGAIVRAIWLRFRITDRRISVIGGWRGQERTDLIYSEITKVVTVPRGLGAWGDMVLTLRDGSRLELRSLPRFREVEAFIKEQVEAKSKTQKS
jgi:nitrogen fixation protein